MDLTMNTKSAWWHNGHCGRGYHVLLRIHTTVHVPTCAAELTTRDEHNSSHKEEDEASDDVLWSHVYDDLQNKTRHNTSWQRGERRTATLLTCQTYPPMYSRKNTLIQVTGSYCDGSDKVSFNSHNAYSVLYFPPKVPLSFHSRKHHRCRWIP